MAVERPIGMTQEEELLYQIYLAVDKLQTGGGGGGPIGSDSVTNQSLVPGANVSLALDNIATLFNSNSIDNNSTVTGSTVTEALETLKASIATSASTYLRLDGTSQMSGPIKLNGQYIFTKPTSHPKYSQNFFGTDAGQVDAGFYMQCASNNLGGSNAFELVAYGQIAVRHRLGSKFYVISEGGPNGTTLWNMPMNQGAANSVLKNLGGPLGDTEWSLLKTINGNSIFGSGDITITGGTGTVNSVNGRNPDGSGNVLLDGTHIEVVPGAGVTVTQAIFDLDSTKIDSIVAGTNITINNTDPKNPIISSTGGGGSSTQALFFSKVGAVNIGDYVKYNGWDAANRAGYVVHTPRTLTGIRIQTSLIQSAASGQAITVQLYKRAIPAQGIGSQNDTVNGTLIGTCTLTTAAGGTFYYASSTNGTITSPNIAAGDMIYAYVSANTITGVTDMLIQVYFQ